MSSVKATSGALLPARSELVSLRQQWAVVALSGFVALLAAGLPRLSWLTGSIPVWAYCSWRLWKGLEENHRNDEVGLLSSLGWPTLVTVFRGWLLAAVSGFLLLPLPEGYLAWVPALAYTSAVLFDHLDGRLARKLGRATRLGSRLDMELDAAGILIATSLLIAYGRLGLWYLAVGLARYVFVAGSSWRRLRGQEVRELRPSAWRRLLAGAQMGFLSAALCPVVPPEASGVAAIAFGSATLAVFWRDWLLVSGRLAPERDPELLFRRLQAKQLRDCSGETPR